MDRYRRLTKPVAAAALLGSALAVLCSGCSDPGTITVGQNPSESTAATPAFSLASGLYTTAQTLTLADATAGAAIYYTTNGTAPTTSSTLYTGAISLPLSTSEVIEAMAVVSGYNNSAVAIAAYTVTPPTVLAPTFNPVPGTYAATQTVTIADGTTGASIYYTTDGTTPTAGSNLYRSSLSVTASETIKAIAVESGYANSSVATAPYTITQTAATPTFTPAPGSYAATQLVTLSDTTPNASIYYTTNGTTPTTSSTLYSGTITVSSSEVIEAIAVASGYASSTVATGSYTITSSATHNLWTWMGGSSSIPSGTAGIDGTYGTKNVEASTNMPGSRAFGDSVNGWAALNGDLWFFGGQGLGASGSAGALNDFWQYDTSTNEWSWLGGSETVNASGVYGTEHTEAAGNIPGARYGAAYWTDVLGNPWLFGGSGYDSTGAQGYLNDLWIYGINTKEWAWAGGSSTVNAAGVYGTQLVAASTNTPGARSGAVTWTDYNDNLWLFGGCNASGSFNDLWEYTGQWIWVSGSNSVNSAGTYGTQGVAASTNVPGARCNANGWIDANNNLWVFGGNGYGQLAGTTGNLNDLWEFNATSKQWIWMGGSISTAAAGVYGTQGVTASTNFPGARQHAGNWTDLSGNFWLFGGVGSDSVNTAGGVGNLNDLWEFNITTKQWVWLNGSNVANAAGSYGTEGVAASTNVPGARTAPLVWTDLSGNLWLLGGSYYNPATTTYYNDLWRYQP